MCETMFLKLASLLIDNDPGHEIGVEHVMYQVPDNHMAVATLVRVVNRNMYDALVRIAHVPAGQATPLPGDYKFYDHSLKAFDWDDIDKFEMDIGDTLHVYSASNNIEFFVYGFEKILVESYSGYVGSSGYSGYSGFSGYSGMPGATGPQGIQGLPGLNGLDGLATASGYSGYSGYSGMGYSGYSGYSGQDGASGYSGDSGYSGESGFSGFSGESGFSGYSGESGYSGYSGESGYSGYSGFSGFSGYSGYSGFSGFSGQDGLSGFSGYSGDTGLSGFSGFSGFSGYSGTPYVPPVFITTADLVLNDDNKPVYLLTESQRTILCDATNGDINVVLPTAVGNAGREYIVKKIDSSTHAVITDSDYANRYELIDNLPAVQFSTQYFALHVVSNGTNWNVISRYYG